MNIGGDWGYFYTKLVSGDRRVTFPSVVGTPERAGFSLESSNHNIILEEPEHIQVGHGAIVQSRTYSQREDSRWTKTPEWYHLFLAGLSELTVSSVSVNLVTGLPVAFIGDKEALQDKLEGTHQVKREGRNRQTFVLSRPRIVPQPFGALLAMALDDNGKIVDNTIASGNVGVADIGGKTCNILSARNITQIGRETASVNVGAWDVERAVRDYLKTECPDLNPRPHDLMDAIVKREIKNYGESVDLGLVVDDILDDMSRQVIAETTRLWGTAAGMDAVLVTGGGALLLGDRLQRHFRHARIVSEPVWANAIGFYKLSQRSTAGE